MSIRLPKQFSELQPFAASWALATEYERAAQRRRSQPAELQAFYDVAIKKLPAILKRVDKYPLGQIKGVDVHLFRLALSLAEVAPHVEFYGRDPKVPFAFAEERMFGFHCAVPD
jgi:hypothetical protein